MFNVKDTNLEALRAKKSAIIKGYMEDQFINFFIPQPVKKEILMNRGYWLRSYCFRTIVKKFIQSSKQPCQIISLGCGLDTLPFNMILENQEQKFKFFECDLKEVVQHKIQIIQQSGQMESYLQQNLPSFTYQCQNQNIPFAITSEKYTLFNCDLNQVENLQSQFQQYGVQKDLPTLIISECVLIYLNEGKSKQLMQMFAQYFDSVAIMDYEMFNGNDGFGKMMVKNFKQRGIPLYSIQDYDNLGDIQNMYIDLKYNCQIKTIKDLYWGGINKQELERINKLEWIDEFEEFNLMCGHYFISIAKFGIIEQNDIYNVVDFSQLQLNLHKKIGLQIFSIFNILNLKLINHKIYSPNFKNISFSLSIGVKILLNINLQEKNAPNSFSNPNQKPFQKNIHKRLKILFLSSFLDNSTDNYISIQYQIKKIKE